MDSSRRRTTEQFQIVSMSMRELVAEPYLIQLSSQLPIPAVHKELYNGNTANTRKMQTALSVYSPLRLMVVSFYQIHAATRTLSTLAISNLNFSR